MKKVLATIALAVAVFGGYAPASAVTVADVKQFDTGYFVPDQESTYDAPYYRWHDEDWNWTHTAMGATTFSSATLNISAWDIDAPYEVDNIYAMDSGIWVLLGNLNGLNDDWGYTTFDIGSNFYDDIANGLQVKIDIDTTHNYDFWAVTLAKSVLSLDGAELPPSDPGTAPVPEPSTFILLGAGLGGIALYRRRMKK